jgi:hypothetical protein
LAALPQSVWAPRAKNTGARDQTFRLIVRPDLWGRQARLRLTNVFGTKPVTFDGVFVGLQVGGAAVAKASNHPVTFSSKSSITIAPGASVWSDAVAVGFVRNPAAPDLAGRKLSVSFHIAGESGPMTWHAKALQISYVSAPDSGSVGQSEDEGAFPYSTASWFFLDAVEMMAPATSFAIRVSAESSVLMTCNFSKMLLRARRTLEFLHGQDQRGH